MKIRFQYNKTSLQEIYKQLSIRENALPVLKNKESALRIEVTKAKEQSEKINKQLINEKEKIFDFVNIWCEFDKNIIQVEDVKYTIKKIAGVRTPVLDKVNFKIKNFSLFEKPKWYYDGIMILKKITELNYEKDFYSYKAELLDHARKKTTQKVNLYEKVQIPEYQEAIRRIKRFLEDEENLNKSSQKIVKKRHEKMKENQAVI